MSKLPTVQEAISQMSVPNPPEEIEVDEVHPACATNMVVKADPVRTGAILYCPFCEERVRKALTANQWESDINGP